MATRRCKEEVPEMHGQSIARWRKQNFATTVSIETGEETTLSAEARSPNEDLNSFPGSHPRGEGGD